MNDENTTVADAEVTNVAAVETENVNVTSDTVDTENVNVAAAEDDTPTVTESAALAVADITVNVSTEPQSVLPENVQVIVDKLLDDKRKYHETELNRLLEISQNNYETHKRLSDASVPGVSKVLDGNVLRWGDTIEVKDNTTWSLIHKAVGPLEQYSKEPVGDGRSKKIRVTVHPKDKRFQGFRFSYVHKLAKGEKCRVVTTTRKVTEVVCDVS